MERRPEVKERELAGLKYFRQLAPLLKRLRPVGTERDRAGNRRLHMDQYVMFVLLFLFNPVVTSLRSIQQASQLKKVQKLLGCGRTSLGSLSEATDIFRSEALLGIIEELGGQLQPVRHDKRLDGLEQTLTAVDGTLLKTIATIAQAAYSKSPRHGRELRAWRLHTHFDILQGVPARIRVTGGANAKTQSERSVLEQMIEPDHCYVLDRGYQKFKLFNAIVARQSSYVARVRDNSAYEILEERELTDADRASGVALDAIVRIGQSNASTERPDHPVRLVMVTTTPHKNRGKYRGGSTGPASDGLIRIATNLVDPPAEVISSLYAHRWTIETFFRFFKHILGCRHLLSADPVGVEIQTYCAIIACLLISRWTGRKPTLRTYEMLCWHQLGMADDEELNAHIERLQPRQQASS